ncbi:hypothetical protein [Arthrobacter sp. Y81]|uniref:hypothetical protein n=1 Tax=Arthrobacter sp. Y81 TaxID=2058897 RepID=UPI0011B02863|nr:hypothetical protein [Arthrobacter sp. Y81]
MSEEQAPVVPAANKDPQTRTYVPSAGSESTREMREMSRRRRDAEEKLQQHLQEADQLHEAHVQAHLKESAAKDEPRSEDSRGEDTEAEAAPAGDAAPEPGEKPAD